MQLMTQKISSNGGRQGEYRRSQWSQLALSRGSERLNSVGFLKTLKAYPGAVRGSSAVGVRRIGCSYTSAQVNIKSFDLSVMDVSPMAARSGGSPRTNGELFGFNGQGPTGIHGDHIAPTNSELFQRVSYDNSLITKADLRADQKNVNAYDDEEGGERARYFAGNAILIKARPDEECTQYRTNSGEDHIGVGAIDINVVHSIILSHQFSKVGDSVKAVR